MAKTMMVVTLMLALIAPVWAGGAPETEEEADPVVVEVMLGSPELAAIEEELWSLYEEANPNVDVVVTAVNEEAMPAFLARVAAGDAPALTVDQDPPPDKDNYQMYVDLRNLDLPYWDRYSTLDGYGAWEEQHGVPATPGAPWQGGRYMSFVYWQETMEEAGLDPRRTVRSMDDLDHFLAELKRYVDQSAEIEYVWDIGWNAWFLGLHFIPALTVALGGDMDTQEAVYRGEISWTDERRNPYAATFRKLKEWTEAGYLPPRWWTRAWEADFEASFIAGKSIFGYHGPWIWSKAAASGRDATLTGLPLPPNSDGIVLGLNAKTFGAGLYSANADSPEFSQYVDALAWMFRPENMKIRCEAYGLTSAIDLDDTGPLNLQTDQYQMIGAPIAAGEFGPIKMDFSLHAPDRVARFKVAGQPNILADDALAAELGAYLSGNATLQQLLGRLQRTWEAAYSFEP